MNPENTLPQRVQTLHRTLRLTSALMGALFGAITIFIAPKLVGAEAATLMSTLPFWMRFAFLATMMVAVGGGMWIGSWLWARLAKHWCTVTADEMKAVYRLARLKPGPMDLKQEAAIERLYGKR